MYAVRGVARGFSSAGFRDDFRDVDFVAKEEIFRRFRLTGDRSGDGSTKLNFATGLAKTTWDNGSGLVFFGLV